MRHSCRFVLVIAFTLLLNACGGGGGGSSAPVPVAPASTGSMDITITGLSVNQSANVLITGADSFSQTVTQNTTLTSLVTGDYQLTAISVSANNVSFSVSPELQSVTVSANSTTNVNIKYAAPTTSVGVIARFGSVFVNGTEFDTDDAEIETDDDEDAGESELKIGMVVTIHGTSSADGAVGDASKIEYQAKAEGPVDAISLADSNLTVLGQVFFIDELTQFENTSFETLLIGDVVELSALSNEDGLFFATRIEKEDSDLIEFKLKGDVINLDESEQTFDIGELSIVYSGAAVDGVLADGVAVKVESFSPVVDGVLIASSVEVLDESIAPGQQLAIDGVIVSFTSTEQFTVNEQNVTTNENTKFKGGAKSDLVIGLRVKVFGALNDENTLVARTVRIDKEGIVKLEGNVESIDAEANTLVVLGITFTTDTHTHFVDKSEADIRQFSLVDMQIGDRVEIKAFEQGSSLVARLVKRLGTEAEDDADATVKVVGPISHIQENSFSIRGVTVRTSEVTEFEGRMDEVLTSAEFYALVEEGDKVEVEGVAQEDSSILALEVELEKSGATHQVKFSGVIDSFESSEQFSVNGHAITTDFKTRYKNGGPDDLADGVHVEIKGTQGDSGIILAKRIEFDGEHERDVELEGVIDSFTSETDFSVEGQMVTTDDDTEYKHGSALNLALDVPVEIDGILTDDGVVLATKIEFEEVEEINLAGPIENFISATEFSVEGRAVTTDDETKYEDGSVSLLADGVFVEIEGVLNDGNVLLASEIKFDEPEEKTVRGEIESITSAADFVVDGQTIKADEFTEYKHGTAEDLALGAFVEVEGFLDSEQRLIAGKVEFEEPEEKTVRGEIESITSTTDFEVDGQAVRTNEFTEYKHGTAEDLALGVFVEVEGFLNNEQVLVAGKVEFEIEDIDIAEDEDAEDGDVEEGTEDQAEDPEEIKVEGEIESFTSATEFVVDNQAITTNESTEYENGTVDNLALGVTVKVTGTLNEDNVLVAGSIEF